MEMQIYLVVEIWTNLEILIYLEIWINLESHLNVIMLIKRMLEITQQFKLHRLNIQQPLYKALVATFKMILFTYFQLVVRMMKYVRCSENPTNLITYMQAPHTFIHKFYT